MRKAKWVLANGAAELPQPTAGSIRHHAFAPYRFVLENSLNNTEILRQLKAEGEGLKHHLKGFKNQRISSLIVFSSLSTSVALDFKEKHKLLIIHWESP